MPKTEQTDTTPDPTMPTLDTNDKASLPATTDDAASPAVPDNGHVPAVLSADDPWRDVDSGDLAPDAGGIPHLQINRKLDGGILDPDTGEVGLEVDFVWLAKSKTRAYWSKPYGSKEAEDAPDCRSLDGVTGQGAYGPGSEDNPTGRCATCPMARWDGSDAPPCKEAVEAMVFIPDPTGAGRLARMRFAGIAFAPAKEYWNSFDNRLPKRPPISFISHLALEPTDTKNGKFLAPRFTRVQPLERADAQPLIEERARRIADWQAYIAQDVEQRDAHQPAEEGPFDGGGERAPDSSYENEEEAPF